MALERLTQITEVGIQSGITLRNVNVEGAYVSGVVTATTLNVTGGGANFAGVVTATSFSGNVTGNINPTTLNVSGVSTFGASSYWGDGDVAYFGDGQDLLIFHNSTDSIIRDNGTGDLNIEGGNRIKLMNPTGIETYAVFNQDGASELWYDNAKKFETTGAGVSVTGIATATGGFVGNLTGNVNATGVSTFSSGINVGSSFIRSTSIGIGTTTTTGRNAGVGTATGTIIFNSTTNSLEIYNSGWFQLQVASFLIDALVVAGGGTGGGPGGIGAGGGAGGVLYAANLPINLGPYPLTVGAGGISTPTGSGGNKNSGNPSNFGSYISNGGGSGGAYFDHPGIPGGSGGGSASDLRGQPSATLSPTPSVGQATQTPQSPGNPYARMLGYGNRGGFATGDLPANPGAIKVAGGGGAGGVGSNGSPTGAPGGPGLTFTIPGSPLTVGGGGGSNGFGVPAGTGGPGGGGNGQPNPQPSVNGTANTGGGGGGGAYVVDNAGSGGSGLVVLKVPTMLTTTFSPGLTVSTSTSQPGYNTYTVTAGTGTVTFS